jgi:hypothetical protein
MEDGGWMLLLVVVILVAALGAALIYGSIKWRRRRSRGMEQIRDDKTRELYGRR